MILKPILQLQLGRNKTLSIPTLPSSAIRTVLAAPHLLHVHAEYNSEAAWRLKHAGARREYNRRLSFSLKNTKFLRGTLGKLAFMAK